VNNVQSFNRTIAPDARALVARADGGKWRFFVSSSQMALIEIEQSGTLGLLPPKRQYVAPNSAIEFQGQGAVMVYATNLSASAETTVETWDAGYLCGGLESVRYSETKLIAENATFSDMGSFGGYPAPYCNHCRLYVDGAQTTRIQAYDYLNNLVFASGYQPVDEQIYIALDTPQAYRWEINKTSAGDVNYTVIWYRE